MTLVILVFRPLLRLLWGEVFRRLERGQRSQPVFGVVDVVAARLVSQFLGAGCLQQLLKFCCLVLRDVDGTGLLGQEVHPDAIACG